MRLIKYFLCLLPFFTVNSQTNFNITTYKEFLLNNQNLEPQQLLEMFDAGTFSNEINVNTAEANYYDSIAQKYNLTNYERELIHKHGFMVSERLSKVSFGEALNEIFHNDLPVYVSTDAILHAFHISYDRILRDLEVELLIPKVSALLDLLHSKMPELHQRYQSNPQMNVMLRDVDVYITVGRKLFNNSAQPYYTENSAWIENIL